MGKLVAPPTKVTKPSSPPSPPGGGPPINWGASLKKPTMWCAALIPLTCCRALSNAVGAEKTWVGSDPGAVLLTWASPRSVVMAIWFRLLIAMEVTLSPLAPSSAATGVKAKPSRSSASAVAGGAYAKRAAPHTPTANKFREAQEASLLAGERKRDFHLHRTPPFDVASDCGRHPSALRSTGPEYKAISQGSPAGRA